MVILCLCLHVSSVQKPGGLFNIEDFTTHMGIVIAKQDFMECQPRVLNAAHVKNALCL